MFWSDPDPQPLHLQMQNRSTTLNANTTYLLCDSHSCLIGRIIKHCVLQRHGGEAYHGHGEDVGQEQRRGRRVDRHIALQYT